MKIPNPFKKVNLSGTRRSGGTYPGRWSTWQLVVRNVAPFLAGAAIGPAVDKVFDMNPGSFDQKTVYVALCVSIVMASISIATYVLLVVNHDKFRSSITKNVFVHRDRRVGGTMRRVAYSLCISKAQEAKSSIVIMGPAFETRHGPGKAKGSAPEKESHDLYLEDGIAAAIDRHIRDEGSDFRYERINQISTDAVRAMSDKNECMASVFNDRGVANHVHEILKRVGESPSVEIVMSARPPIPSFPSTLVIDDKYVFFSMPTPTPGAGGEDGSSDEERRYDIVLGFEDLTGEIPRLFRQIILGFKHGSVPINGVTMS